ncbi:MAG: hypothetical protein ACP5PS_00290 [Bacteroidales bacterium]
MIKRVSISIVLFALSLQIKAALITSAASGNWSNPATWTGGVVPGAADSVRIRNGHTITVDGNYTCKTLGLNGGANNTTLTIAGTNVLTVIDLVSLAAPLVNSKNTTLNVGNGKLTCNTINMGSTNADSRDVILVIAGGTVTVNGNIQMPSSALRNHIDFTGAGQLEVKGNISGGGISQRSGTGSTVLLNGTTTQTLTPSAANSYDFYNLRVQNNTKLAQAITVRNLYIENTATLNTQEYTITGNASGVMNMTAGTTLILGNPGVATAVVFPINFTAANISLHTTSTVTYTAGANQTVSAVPTYGNLNIAAGSTGNYTRTLGDSVTVLGNLTISGTAGQTATLLPDAYNLTVKGTTTINNNGILNDATANGTLDFNGLITINAGGQYINSNNSSNIFRGGIVNNGTFNKTGTGTSTFATNNQTISGSNVLNFSGGDFIINNPASLNVTASINFGGTNFTNNSNAAAAFNATAGTFTFTPNAAQNIGGTGSGTVTFYNVTFAGGNTKTANIPFSTAGAATINNGVTLSLGTTAKTINFGGDLTVDGTLNFGTTAAKIVNVAGNLLDVTGTIDMTGAGLAHTLNLNGTSNAITTFNTTAGSGSTVSYVRAGAQTMFASANYQNLTLNNGDTKSLSGITTVNGTLTLNGSILQLGNFNLILTTQATSNIGGGPFSASCMIATDGTGYLQQAIPTSVPYTVPLGSNNTYSPVTVNAISGTTYLRYRTVYSTGLGSNYLKRYWQLTASAASTATVTFTYDATENPTDPMLIWYRTFAGTWATPTGTQSFNDIAKTFTITGTTNLGITTTEWTAGYPPNTFFSYQSGNWNDSATWTSDPGGTTYVNIGTPTSDGDVVVILSGRTVTLTGNVTTTNLDITINEGGVLDMATYQFTNTLKKLSGQGILRLASTSFPGVTTNTFVNSGGGITEYYNAANFTLPVTQTVYNTLRINAPGVTATQLNNLTLNGDLHVMRGTYRINDGTSARRQLTIYGNVTVESGASITVGNGVTNTTTDPTAVAEAGTAPFIDYYDAQSHRVVVYGDFTNHGTVRFTNLTYPVYNQFPPLVPGATTGFATVYFRGNTSNTLYCDGTTDFYNLVLDKGVDQTYSLTVYSTAYPNFRLFGANIAGGYGGGANPNLCKALWIRNGTLVLQGTTVIPSLSEGNCDIGTGGPNSDFYVPGNGAFILDGDNVVVLTTADSYQEVNVAYGVSAPSDAAMGVNTGAGCSSFSIYGLLQVNKGYISTRESGGFIQWAVASGQFVIKGGTVDAKQYRTAGTGGGLASYSQSGGDFYLRGRFRRTPTAYTSVADLVNAPITTNRYNGGLQGVVGTFNLNETANVFTMTGGNMYIYDVCGDGSVANQQKAFEILASTNNINVTGGNVYILPTNGTLLPNSPNYRIVSTAQFANLIINRQSGTSVVLLDTYPLTVFTNFSLLSGDFNANNLNVTIGGNMTVSAGTTYTPGSNWTIFNGTGNQVISVNTVGPLTFKKFRMDKPVGKILSFAGTQSNIGVADSLMLLKGTFNDGGKTITMVPSTTTTTSYIYNSGVHLGTGKIVLADDDPQVIDGDGNGIFNNLELNNTDALTAPISLRANTTISGTLTFSQDKLFNIGVYNLKFTGSASISGYSATRYIVTQGQAGNGGVTRTYSPSANSFTFPVGAASTSHATPAYTPATITITGTPTTWGNISVVPVGYEHPATTVKNRSLTYYWRVKSSGLTLGTATATLGFTYDQADVITGADITEDEYVAARFDINTTAWTRGVAADVDETNNIVGEPGSGNFLENVSFIDGDYTAGDDNPTNPFGTPTVYYSRQSGLWGNVNSWSTVSHTGPPAAAVPTAGDIVIIGDNDSIYLNTNLTTPNVDVRSCAILKIESGSALDIGYNPGCNFALVLGHPNGNGNLRLTTNYNSPSTYQFPAGDYTDFNVNLGTTEMYTTNPIAGTTYYLPNGTTEYGNLILSPLGGSNIIFPNNNLLIYGNLTTRGQNADSRFCPVWNTNYPTPPNVRIAKTITINGNLNIQGGALVWYGGGSILQTIEVKGNVFVNSASAIDNWDGSAARMYIGGNLTNNTTGATGGGIVTPCECDFRNIPLTFNGSGTATIGNTANTPITRFGQVIVDKGTSLSDSLIITIGGTLTSPVDNWLTLRNGTLVYRRTNPSSDFTISTTTSFVIPETAGLYIDYPNNAGNSNILIANAAVNNNDLMLFGKLTLKAGNVYVGPINGTTNNNNDIEYSGDGNSTLIIDGGRLFVNGQIRRSTATTTGVLKYYQSAGDVTINGQGADVTALTRAKLEVVNTGSVFNMSGGTITIVQGGGTTFGDLYLRPASGNVTGGQIIFTQTPAYWATIDAVQNYRMDANISLNELIVMGKVSGTARSATVNLMVNPLTLNGTLTLTNNQSFLVANDHNITIKGDLINNGTYTPGTNTTTFNGGAQNILGTSTTNFYHLVVNPITSLTLSNTIGVNGNLTLSSGTLICGNNAVNLAGNLTNNANYTDNGNGTGIMLVGSALQYISGTGTFSTLTLNNLNGARLQSSITLNKNLVLVQGNFNINQYMLTLGVNSIVDGAPFSAAKMVVVDGVFSNVGIRKYFNAYSGPAISFTNPNGVTGKYTPAVFTYSKNDLTGFVRINAINDNHPGVIDANSVLQYYWEVQNNAVSGVNGSLVFYYKDADVLGNEANYVAARTVGGTSWSKAAPGPSTDNVDETANTITFPLVGADDLNGEYTAGEDPAIPNNIPQFTSVKDGNWNDPTVWTQTGGDPYTLTGGPNGFIAIISSNDTVTINQNQAFTYHTTINGTLRAVQPYYGHNIGIVTGTGTLYLDGGPFPAGRYDSFIDCATGGTIEYGGNTSYNVVADLYSSLRKLRFTGTGNRYLPNKDLTICEQLLINGPTVDNSVNNRKLTIKGTFERYGTGAFKAGTGANAMVEFAGTSAQSVGGPTGDFSGTNRFYHLKVNNSNGLTIGAGGTVEVAGNLYLTAGKIITTTTNVLRIVNTAINCVVPAGGSSASYVDGPLTKRILSGDNFKFPVGKGAVLGNKITLSSSQPGTIDWTVEFFTPNSNYNSYAAPLTYVNSKEYWKVSAVSGSQAYVGLDWDPASDLTPLMTQNGLSDMRVAYDNAGTWTVLTSTATGDNYNGTVTTALRITIPGAGTMNYTTACINTIKPRAKLNPTGPVCGTAGIPVTFTGSNRPFNYILGYTKDGVPQTPVTVTSEPYVLPTDATGATYQLTSFIYDDPGNPTTGVVDPTPVTTYTIPTTANAGPDQSLCGATSATLAGNTPVVGSGLWSIASGLGGTVVTPTVPNSQFNGINGNTYQLVWTITNGGCYSRDTVVISFPLLPTTPSGFILFDNSVCQGDMGVAYSVANDPTVTFSWIYSGTGATINGTGNAVTVDYSVTATSGNIGVYTTNGCGNSDTLELAVTVHGLPNATLAVSGSATVCEGDSTTLTITISGGTSPYNVTLTDGTSNYNLNNITSPYVYNTGALSWVGPLSLRVITYSIPTVVTSDGCTAAGSNTVNVNVYKTPDTGPSYHLPNKP